MTDTATRQVRTYTDDQRAEAVALVAEHGLAEAHRRVDIPKETIRRWANRAGVTTGDVGLSQAKMAEARAEIEAIRARLRVKLAAVADRLVDRVYEPEVDYRGQHAERVVLPEAAPQSAKNLLTAAAIAVDKLRLELGEVTDRTESRSTDSLTADIERLAGELAGNDPEPVKAGE